MLLLCFEVYNESHCRGWNTVIITTTVTIYSSSHYFFSWSPWSLLQNKPKNLIPVMWARYIFSSFIHYSCGSSSVCHRETSVATCHLSWILPYTKFSSFLSPLSTSDGGYDLISNALHALPIVTCSFLLGFSFSCHFVTVSPAIWPANFPLTFSTFLIVASCTL